MSPGATKPRPEGFLLSDFDYLSERKAGPAIGVKGGTLTNYRKRGLGPEYTVVGRRISIPAPPCGHGLRKAVSGGQAVTIQVLKRCIACGRPLPAGSHGRRMFCPEVCGHRKRPAPAVYRYTAPDGRSYIGSAGNIGKRDQRGLGRSNSWLIEAFVEYPPEMWTFEVLKMLPPGCSKQRLRRAEQRYIERYRSWSPEHGFNIFPAVWFGGTPGVLASRARRAEQVRKDIVRRIIERAKYTERADNKRSRRDRQ